MLDIIDEVNSNLLETLRYIGILSLVMEAIILIKLHHFEIGSINPSCCAKLRIKFHSMLVITWNFESVLVLWG